MTNQPDEQNRKLRELLLKLGQSYLDRGRFQDALDKLTQLLALEPANEQALLLATKASIALEDVSDDALALYNKALDSQLDSNTGQAINQLLESFEVETALTVEIKKKLEALDISDEDTEQESQSNQITEIPPIEENPENVFTNEIENLWWNSKFEEAIKIINANNEFSNEFLHHQLLLTHAYKSLSGQQKNSIDTEVIEQLQTQLGKVKPDSLNSIKNIIALMYALPEESLTSNGKHDDSCEFQFILGKIAMEDFFHELQKKPQKPPTKSEILNGILFDELKKPEGWNSENENLNFRWASFLATSLVTSGDTPPPSKIVDLVASYLFKIPQSVLRFTEDGFLSFAENPLKQIIAVLNLYKSIAHYNKAADPKNQIILKTSIITQQPNKDTTLDSSSFKLNILESLHLLQHIKVNVAGNYSLYIQCPKAVLNELKQLDENIEYDKPEKIYLLPGLKSDCYAIARHEIELEIENDSPPEIQDLKILEKLQSQFPFNTYLTRNKKLERPVILKTISYKKGQDIEKQKKIALANIKKLGRLNHPNIATLFDLGENEDQVYYTREYTEGESLLKINKSEKEWEINFCATLEKIIRALQTAESDDIFHLNLKPSNIRINEANTLKLTDFDVFQTADKNSKDMVELKSTMYLAPEVIQNRKGDSRSDIYSIGLIIYEILNGKSPYSIANNDNSDSPKLDLFKNNNSEINQGWIKIIQRATEDNPKARYQTLNELELEIKKLYLELSSEVQVAE